MAQLSLVVLRASEPARAVAFYSGLGLNFEVERHGKGPEHHSCKLGGSVLEIYPCGSGDQKTTATRLGFVVPSLEKAIASVRQLEGHVASEPCPMPWGLRAVVVDPDGHKIELTQQRQRHLERMCQWKRGKLQLLRAGIAHARRKIRVPSRGGGLLAIVRSRRRQGVVADGG